MLKPLYCFCSIGGHDNLDWELRIAADRIDAYLNANFIELLVSSGADRGMMKAKRNER